MLKEDRQKKNCQKVGDTYVVQEVIFIVLGNLFGFLVLPGEAKKQNASLGRVTPEP